MTSLRPRIVYRQGGAWFLRPDGSALQQSERVGAVPLHTIEFDRRLARINGVVARGEPGMMGLLSKDGGQSRQSP